MFAVVKTGGKQYRVTEGLILRVEKIEAEEGATIELSEVLMLSDGAAVAIGTPSIAGAVVTAEVRSQARTRKIEIIKFRRRKHYRKRQGHRQHFTELKIISIKA